MILTGKEIIREHQSGRITIDPFREDYINPNSYNYRLADSLLVSHGDTTEACIRNYEVIKIPSEGFVLQPKVLYLASTLETIGSSSYVTTLIGRSSIGRLGLFLQLSADLGHTGAIHKWTLELTCIQRVRIYAGMRIGQVSFWTCAGEADTYSNGYADFDLPTPSIRDLRGHTRQR